MLTVPKAKSCQHWHTFIMIPARQNPKFWLVPASLWWEQKIFTFPFRKKQKQLTAALCLTGRSLIHSFSQRLWWTRIWKMVRFSQSLGKTFNVHCFNYLHWRSKFPLTLTIETESAILETRPETMFFFIPNQFIQTSITQPASKPASQPASKPHSETDRQPPSRQVILFRCDDLTWGLGRLAVLWCGSTSVSQSSPY